MSRVSICLFKLGLCVCGHPANARTATGSHGKWSLNSLRLACLSLRQEEVGLTIGRLFTQREIFCFCHQIHSWLLLFSSTASSQVSCFICYEALIKVSTRRSWKPKPAQEYKAKWKTSVTANLWFHSCLLSISSKLSHSRHIAQAWNWENHDIPTEAKVPRC